MTGIFLDCVEPDTAVMVTAGANGIGRVMTEAFLANFAHPFWLAGIRFPMMVGCPTTYLSG